LAASRWCYNQTIEYINGLDGPRPHWTVVKKMILATCPDWMRAVPYQIKSVAVSDACEAFSAQKKKAKQTGEPFKMRFRSRRNPKQSCFIPASAVKQKDNAIGVYLRIAGVLKAAEPLPQQHRDSRLVWDNGAWFLSVPFRVTVQQKADKGRTVALDPGVRTFQTLFSLDSHGKIGEQAQQRIVRLLVHLDRLISRRAKGDKRSKRRLTLAIGRMRRKISNLIDELHWKTIRFLLDEFDTIIIPPFAAGRMASRTSRKLRNKSVRAMLGLAHSRFRLRLVAKADQEQKTVLIQDEAYTSKTCSWSGEIILNLGSRYRVRGSDGVSMDRDINGARGVFLRALEDTPLMLA
jgi:putative transposase